MGYLRTGACALALLLATTAGAQTLPAPAEFYFDADTRTVTPLVAIEGDDDQTHARLMQLVDRNGRAAETARAQLARALMRSGREDTGRAMYAQAFSATSNRSPLRSALHWNFAWDLYRLGHHTEALDQWRQALDGRLVRPTWAPPTLALALWSAGRRDEALQWYAAAVRTEPTLWNDPARYPTLLPDWTAGERATLAEVFAAWQAAPPAWP